MLTIHHLGASQSERVVWLMEELGLPYEMVWRKRGADGRAPAWYLALHPAATAPLVQDGDRMLCESAAILEYVCHKYAGGRLAVAPDQVGMACPTSALKPGRPPDRRVRRRWPSGRSGGW